MDKLSIDQLFLLCI